MAKLLLVVHVWYIPVVKLWLLMNLLQLLLSRVVPVPLLQLVRGQLHLLRLLYVVPHPRRQLHNSSEACCHFPRSNVLLVGKVVADSSWIVVDWSSILLLLHGSVGSYLLL
jgi:hypothetical protein